MTELEALRARLAGKERECAKLYRLINRYKPQITDLEIEVVERDMEIESLRDIIKQHSGKEPS